MSKMTVVIDDELENEFRKAIFEDRGMKRGNIHDVIEEAIKLWIQEKVEKRRERDV